MTEVHVNAPKGRVAAAGSALAKAALALACLLTALVAFGCTPSSITSTDINTDVSAVSNVPDYETATVERVVDGDTLIVHLDGERQRVRLIGINCPESVAPEEERNTAEGHSASDHTKTLVSEGDTVYLVKDVSDTDQYDRLLRYVWLGIPTADLDATYARSNMLNAMIVADGYAEARRYGSDTTWSDVFAQLAEEAKAQGLGVSSTF